MNYSVRKPRGDSRHNTCGVALEDGQVAVIEYTRKTFEKLKNLEEFGYLTNETKAEVGTYDEDEFDRLYPTEVVDADDTVKSKVKDAEWTLPRSKRGSKTV